MYCPRCRSEYRQNVTRCQECDCDLIEELPPADQEVPEWTELVTDTASDASMLAIAKSLLHAAGVPYHTPTEGIQEMIGAGRILGPSFALGPVRVQVLPRHAAAARRALDRLNEADETRPSED